MVRVSGIEINFAETSISKLGDSSAYKAVVVKGQGAIRHSLVPEQHVRTRWLSRGGGYGHMVFRANDFQVMREQFLVDFVE